MVENGVLLIMDFVKNYSGFKIGVRTQKYRYSFEYLYFFMFHIEIKYVASWLTAASRAVNPVSQIQVLIHLYLIFYNMFVILQTEVIIIEIKKKNYYIFYCTVVRDNYNSADILYA